MKILHVFDSLKFVRAMFVALFAAFFFGCFSNFASADTVKNLFNKDTYSTASGYYINNGKVASAPSNKTVVIDVKPNTTYSYWHTAGTGGGRSFATNGIVEIGDDASWLNNQLTIARNEMQTITIPSNMNKLYICVGRSGNQSSFEEQFADFMLVEGIPDSTDYVPFVPEQIKIATTKYNEAKFAQVETRLDAAVAAVDTVVSQTMTQAQQIDQIATNKQTRPDEECTAKYCLLIEDENGTPHWYPIAGANGVEYVLPAGYTQLTYIQSDGRQMINTGYVLQETDSVEVDYKLTDLTRTGDKFIVGAQPVSDVSIGSFWVETYSDTNNWYIRYGSGTSANTSGSVTPTSQFSGTLAVSKNSFVVNGVEILTPDFVSMPVNPMTIFNRISRDGSIGNNGASAQISEVRVKNGHNLVHRYIPVRNSNNDLGMYDTVRGQFFTNAGTGAFTAGPVVE